MRSTYALVLCLLAGLCVAWAGAPAPAAADPIQAADALVTAQMASARVPGAAVAIVKDGRIVHLQGYGIAGPAGRKATPETPFMIGSLSKSFTALAIMQLAEAGRVDLDAPVRRYIPWFRYADAQASAQVTVRHLLYHTTGIRANDTMPAMLVKDQSEAALERQVRSLERAGLVAAPGQQFAYCNLNYDVLGLIVQTVSGQPYESYVAEHILAPLAMRNTFTSRAEAGARMADGHQWWFGLPRVSNIAVPRGSTPSGGIVASAEDMAHYLLAHLDEGRYGGARIVSPAGIAELHKPGVETAPGVSYAMGWVVDTRADAGTLLLHTGATMDFQASMVLVPQARLGVFVAMNAANLFEVFRGEGSTSHYTAMSLARLMLGREPAPAPTPGIREMYQAVDAIVVLLTAWALVGLALMPRWYRRFKQHLPKTTARLIGHLLWTAALHFVWPVGLFLALPAMMGYPELATAWPFMILWLPDVTCWLLALMALSLMRGIAEVVLKARAASLVDCAARA